MPVVWQERFARLSPQVTHIRLFLLHGFNKFNFWWINVSETVCRKKLLHVNERASSPGGKNQRYSGDFTKSQEEICRSMNTTINQFTRDDFCDIII